MSQSPQHFAIVGAGMAGLTCARTLLQAGQRVTLFEQADAVGGRMATCETPFGGFDTACQYFTVRDPRFEQALQSSPGLCKPWSANSVSLLDAHGRISAHAADAHEPHWVPVPTMQALPQHWAEPLRTAGRLHLCCRVERLEVDDSAGARWRLRVRGPDALSRVEAGFDGVLLAATCQAARSLLQGTEVAADLLQRLQPVEVAPTWSLMLAFPNAVQPTLSSLGPQWNVARSTHHRIAWLARESSKPQRSAVERWTVHASADWSRRHFDDAPARIRAKLSKAFAEVTGIHAEPAYTEVLRWDQANTLRALGQSYLWDGRTALGVCGDYLLGCRVEDAFVSGLELAQALA